MTVDDTFWDQAIRSHRHRVVVSLLALGLPFDRAEDVAHEAFLKLMDRQRAGKLREITLPGLAITQARFLALNALRQEGSQRRREDAQTLPEAPPSVDARLVSKSELQVVHEVLRAASESARAVFRELARDPPPAHREVAERVGLSVQRVRQILCEVRKELRAALDREQP